MIASADGCGRWAADPWLRIGAVTLDHRVLMAPMVNYNETSIRQLARRFGSGWVISEMIHVDQLLAHGRGVLRVLEREPQERPFALQVAGREEAELVAGARLAEEEGFALYDLNMGCPTRKQVRRGVGVALMREPAHVHRVLRSVVRAVSIPVTVKMRAGWDACQMNAAEVARAVEDAGVAAIAVHGRTKMDWYGGDCSHEVIRSVKEAVRVPVIGNGDVRTVDDAERMVRATGCDAVMVGRAAVGHPWFFAELVAWFERGERTGPASLEARRATFDEQAALLEDRFGEKLAARRLRLYMFHYVRDFLTRGEALLRLGPLHGLGPIREAVHDCFEAETRARLEEGEPAATT
ncbi:MAG: tRNA dihydrouridine synthase DusB [Planctomycetes bacterium]|nr:tRNA dihydrouridine synthase DusB [Planctomycetota bacterium]